jgi:chemotaxis signal transduction protein
MKLRDTVISVIELASRLGMKAPSWTIEANLQRPPGLHL